MAKVSFTKKLTRSNLNLAGMKDQYVTVPKRQVDPEIFFCKPPNEIKFIDKSTKSFFLFPFKKEKNGEHRLSRMRAYYELKGAKVGDQIIIRKKKKKDKGVYYEIDLIMPHELLDIDEKHVYFDAFTPEEENKLPEGSKLRIVVNRYERSKKAREKCIEHWKLSCSVCKMEFENVYGELGKGFIHVHHKVPLSEIGKKYKIDPIKDLVPVCPNCHAMLHKKKPPYTIEEIKDILVK